MLCVHSPLSLGIVGFQQSHQHAEEETRSMLTLSIFLRCILFLMRSNMRPNADQKNMMMMKIIIGIAISQNRRSVCLLTDHMNSKFIPCASIAG